jgi:hypothetical protein
MCAEILTLPRPSDIIPEKTIHDLNVKVLLCIVLLDLFFIVLLQEKPPHKGKGKAKGRSDVEVESGTDVPAGKPVAPRPKMQPADVSKPPPHPVPRRAPVVAEDSAPVPWSSQLQANIFRDSTGISTLHVEHEEDSSKGGGTSVKGAAGATAEEEIDLGGADASARDSTESEKGDGDSGDGEDGEGSGDDSFVTPPPSGVVASGLSTATTELATILPTPPTPSGTSSVPAVAATPLSSCTAYRSCGFFILFVSCLSLMLVQCSLSFLPCSCFACLLR